MKIVIGSNLSKIDYANIKRPHIGRVVYNYYHRYKYETSTKINPSEIGENLVNSFSLMPLLWNINIINPLLVNLRRNLHYIYNICYFYKKNIYYKYNVIH